MISCTYNIIADSVMKQLKTQCCPLHGATTKQKQTTLFFSWQLKTTSRLPWEREPESSCSGLGNTGTAALQGLETTWCQEPSKGLVQTTDRGLARPARPIRTSIKLSSTARWGQPLRKTAWGERNRPGGRARSPLQPSAYFR